MCAVQIILALIRGVIADRANFVAENLALRQQLAVLERRSTRPRLRKRDRIFWVWLSHFWTRWRSVLLTVQPDTVVRWHHQGFKLNWGWKSRGGRVGRPRLDAEIRKLIRGMWTENPKWVCLGSSRSFSCLAIPWPSQPALPLAHLVSRSTGPQEGGRMMLRAHSYRDPGPPLAHRETVPPRIATVKH